MIKISFKNALPLASGAAIAGLLMLGACEPKNKGGDKGVGIDLVNLDTTVSAGDDFFQYANGGWLKNNPIPATESRWGSFSELQENNFKILKSVLEGAAANTGAAKGSKEQMIGDFYASGMDSVGLEKAGVSPIKPELDKIAALKDVPELLAMNAELQRLSISPLFTFYVYIDEKNSSAFIPYAMQGGLGLPDRDYYLENDERSKTVRTAYLAHLTKMNELSGDAPAVAKSNAEKILKIETELAKASRSKVALRDPEKNYNKFAVADLSTKTPNINWTKYLSDLGVQGANEIVVGQPEYLKRVNDLLKSVPMEDWKLYLRWHLIHGLSSELSNAFVMENFRMYGTVLSGTKEIKPRWKRVLSVVDMSVGEQLGQLYVEKAFKPEAKAKALEMVNNLADVLKTRIEGLPWMVAETKTKALAKLGTFLKKIGYPDKWKDYSGLELSRESYARNCMNAAEFEHKRMISKIGKPVDKGEWLMTPPTVNAYYNPPINEIVFPAGILQPPFFDPNADDAVNYGGIGAVIGHEMTHGFDDQGRLYDSEGNLKNWWTSEDSANYSARTTVIEKQYSAYTVLDSLHVNGKLTMGENIADIGGLKIAYLAFKKTKQGQGTEKIDGLTPDQRFFISWAQAWRQNIRPEALELRIKTDPHSPGKYRTNGVVANMTEFYDAFNVKEGSKMFIPLEGRAQIW